MILVVGQNSTWQKTYFFEGIERGSVNRVREARESAAGKGANVGRVLARYRLSHLVFGYNGGPTGAKFAHACESDGVSTHLVEMAGETRTCVTLIESDGVVTELVEPAPAITQSERDAFHEAVLSNMSGASFLCISGTAMSGETEDCYYEFARAAKEAGVPILLDSYKAHALRALEAGPELLKINDTELAALSGLSTETADDRAAACAALRSRHGIRWCIITRGADGVEGYAESMSVLATPPQVEAVNPIGSGDSVSAGVLSVLETDGGSFDELCNTENVFERAVLEGAAAGTANCLSWKPAAIEPGDLKRVRGGVTLSRD
ncbi:MAG: 1-phosphofructokinase family hexose kinase [Spirochaetales bacterium]